MIKKIILIACFFVPYFVFSQLIAFRDTVDDAYNFWLYLPPQYDTVQQDLPTVLFLHGNSLCGNDLNRVRRYGCLDALAMGRAINAIVVAPQNPGGRWKEQRILNIVDWVQKHYKSDTNRFYVLGMSLGGYGTLDFVGSYPQKVAAAMALCGGSTLKEFCNLNEVPLWIMHGTADNAVSIKESQKVVDAMKKCGNADRLIFSKMSGQSHSALARVLYLPETYQWLFAHSRADTSRTLDTTVKITIADFQKAYQNVDRKNTQIQVIDNKPTKAQTGTETKSVVANSHVVRQGDTLYAIARRYGTTVAKLCQLNHLTEQSILQIGQSIKLK